MRTLCCSEIENVMSREYIYSTIECLQVHSILIYKSLLLHLTHVKKRTQLYPLCFSSACQPNVGMLDRSAAGGSAGGMLDRSRMALCAFTFLFVSLNPLASLLSSSGSSSAGSVPVNPAHHAGRSVLGVDIAGMEGR